MAEADIHLLAGVISAFVSTLLLASAWHKWQDLPLFRNHVAAYGLLPDRLADAASHALPVLEVLAAVLMWLPALQGVGHGMAVALLVVYAAAMAVNVLQGRTALECGCGGPALQVSWWLVARNIAIAAGCGLASFFAGYLQGIAPIATALCAGALLWMLYALTEKVLALMAKAQSLQAAMYK